jgi:aspartate racemase
LKIINFLINFRKLFINYIQQKQEDNMPKHIGIVACSAEGAALCYRTICAEAAEFLGEYMHPEISMHTHPLAEYMKHIRSDNWDGVADLMLSSAKKLADTGAEFLICPDNTIYQAFGLVAHKSPLPWIHIAENVGMVAKEKGFKNLLITGTKYLTTGPVYPAALDKINISYQIPDEPEREQINEIIFSQLVYGIFPEESRHYFNTIFQKYKDKGCDAAVLGCTEIPLLVDPDDCPLPTLDSTRLLARSALKMAIEKD